MLVKQAKEFVGAVVAYSMYSAEIHEQGCLSGRDVSFSRPDVMTHRSPSLMLTTSSTTWMKSIDCKKARTAIPSTILWTGSVSAGR